MGMELDELLWGFAVFDCGSDGDGTGGVHSLRFALTVIMFSEIKRIEEQKEGNGGKLRRSY